MYVSDGFNLQILQHGQFGKQPHILGQISDIASTQATPIPSRISTDILIVKSYCSLVVGARTIDKCAHRRFAGAALGTDQIPVSALKFQIFEPYAAPLDNFRVLLALEHFGQGMAEGNATDMPDADDVIDLEAISRLL